jgi:pyruvate kinase
MLSEETAMGQHVVRTVETMASIARNAEEHMAPLDHAASARSQHISKDALAVSHAAVELADSVNAAAIVTPTRSGATARHVARLRPRVPILALSRHGTTIGRLLMAWGVTPCLEDDHPDLSMVIHAASEQLLRQRLARPGDAFILTAGFPAGQADSNLLTVQHIPGGRVKASKRRPRSPARAR